MVEEQESDEAKRNRVEAELVSTMERIAADLERVLVGVVVVALILAAILADRLIG